MKMVKERVRCGKCRRKVLPIGQAVWAVSGGVRPVAGDVVGHKFGGEDAEICHHHIVQTVGGERVSIARNDGLMERTQGIF